MNSYGTPSLGIRAVKRINKLKIGWVSPYNLEAAQSRIRVINIHRRLVSIGWFSKIIDWDQIDEFDIIIVGKEFSQNAIDKVEYFKSKGKYVICDVCEDLTSIKDASLQYYYNRLIQISHKVICASKELARVLSSFNGNIEVIEDAFESDINLNCAYIDDPSKKLKVVYFGYGGNSYLAEDLKDIVEELDMELILLTEWNTATIKWEKHSWVQHLLTCDICIIPQRKDQQCKSNNKLTQAMALGLPTITSPLPAYLDVVEDFIDSSVFKCETKDDWKKALERFKSWSERYQFGQLGKEIAKNYSIPIIADKWVSVFEKIPSKVDIIIPTKDNYDYLEQAIQSLIHSKNSVPSNLIIVDNSENINHKSIISLAEQHKVKVEIINE